MIRIALPMPPSVNGLYANKKAGGRTKTAEYKAWHKLASTKIKASHRQALGPYNISIQLRQSVVSSLSDIANREKALSDFLVSHGVIKDDRYCRSLFMTWAEDIEADCVVIVEPVEVAK